MTEDPTLFTRTAYGLTPCSESAREVLKSIPLNVVVKAEISRGGRSLPMLRLYWGLCGTIAEAIGANRENVSDVIKLRSGHFVVVETKSGRVQLPRSISFAKMSQAEFKAFFDKACMVVCEELLPHVQPGELRQQIEHMVGIPSEAAA